MKQMLRCTGGLYYFRIPNSVIKKEILSKGKFYTLIVQEVGQNDG